MTDDGRRDPGSDWYLEQVVDHLAEAWYVIHDPTKERQELPDLPFYISEDWVKLTGRLLKDWAATHERPVSWPWRQPEFDRFWTVEV
jgi:hypothetical protein